MNTLSPSPSTPAAGRCSVQRMVQPDNSKAADGKHYWNGWTYNYTADRDGYCNHAWCEEDCTGKSLCGVVLQDGGGLSIPHDLERPSCAKCRRIMEKRDALRLNVKIGDGGTPFASSHG